MPSTPTISTSSSPLCNHFTQLHFSDPTTTVLNANTNRNRARAASSSGLTPIRPGVTPKKLLHISFTELNIRLSLVQPPTQVTPFIARCNWLAVFTQTICNTNAVCASPHAAGRMGKGGTARHLRPDLVAHLSPTLQDPRRRSPLGNIIRETPTAGMQVSTQWSPVMTFHPCNALEAVIEVLNK